MSDAIVFLLMEGDRLNVVKDAQQVSLDGVRVGSLPKNFQQSWVGHEEETREDESLLLEVTSERLLTEFQLLQEMGE